MSELVFLIIGLLIGGCLAVTFMSCLQLGRINRYEAEIRRLKEQIK